MDEPFHLVELETMLLGRHALYSRYRRGDSRLERSTYLLLSRLAIDGPMSIGQLSDAFGLDASTLNRQTAALSHAGLVKRIPDPDGGMARKFRLTPEGARRLDAERAGNIDGLKAVMRNWSPEDVTALAGYLRRLNTDIEDLAGHAWPRP